MSNEVLKQVINDYIKGQKISEIAINNKVSCVEITRILRNIKQNVGTKG